MTDREIKDRVRAQFTAAGDAYVRSAGHAGGNDLHRMIELGQPQATDRLLDIATGGGHVARTFAPLVASVVASDLTPEILRHAADAFEAAGLTNVTTALADAEALPFDDASFEIVTCRIAPHHFPNPAAFVHEVARVLTPGGRFLLIDSTVVPGAGGDAFNAIEKLRDPSHVRSLTIAEWSSTIADAGLTLIVTETFEKSHDFAEWVGRSRSAADAIAAIETAFRSSDDAFREAHRVVFDGDRLVSFVDTKTLFAAVKPGS